MPIIISLPFCSFNRARTSTASTSSSPRSFDIQRRELAISVHWASCCAPTLHAGLRGRYAIAEERSGNKNGKKRKEDEGKRAERASEIEIAVSLSLCLFLCRRDKSQAGGRRDSAKGTSIYVRIVWNFNYFVLSGAFGFLQS